MNLVDNAFNERNQARPKRVYTIKLHLHEVQQGKANEKSIKLPVSGAGEGH